ncbi:MAG TPA: indole-3-glycerol-phosphate synthase TrpC, partial [Vicinamibacteria bacterium]|nr:indole-3-glycerol-phosphate synthase TrpC [Vicinamibacteria bacterium]
MTGLVEDLVRSARERARRLPAIEPSSPPPPPSFDAAIRGRDRVDVIAEFKRRSPSLGRIAELDPETQVRRYREAGA